MNRKYRNRLNRTKMEMRIVSILILILIAMALFIAVRFGYLYYTGNLHFYLP